MMTWTDEQIDSWCLSFRSYREGTSALTRAQDLQQQRCRVRQEMLHYLTTFLNSRSTLKDFHTALQYKAHPDWNLFGIHGLSGTTFLKKLVQVISHQEQLTLNLRSALLAPKDVRQAHQCMYTFRSFLEGLIAGGQISRAQLQPDRIPLFLSIWWSVQDDEAWPRFTGVLRQHLLQELPLLDPISDQIALYFAFRERFLALKTAFGISAWELDHFLSWQIQQEQKKEKTVASARQRGKSASLLDQPSQRHALQWLLAKIGRKVGCQVWIARKDHEKIWMNEVLGNLSMPELPALDSAFDQRLLEDVAVLWFSRNEIIATYEIISNNSEIITPLLNLYDFGLTWAKRRTRLCLILPQTQFDLAQRELARPLFHQQQARRPCGLISEENLLQNGEHILRWATDPAIIEDIIEFSHMPQFFN